jgi:raffinose/stachyose/melibiose transport system substrate-binding protein
MNLFRNGRRMALAAIIGAMAVLAACGSNSGNGAGTATNSGTAGADAAKPVTISFIHWRGEDATVFDTLLRKFEAENKGIKVETQRFPARSSKRLPKRACSQI